MQAKDFFPRIGDSPEELNRKTARLVSARAGIFGTQTVEAGADAVAVTPAGFPDKNIEAWTVIRNNSAKSVALTGTRVDPQTLASGSFSATLAPGVALEGYFTAVTLAGSEDPGSVELTILRRATNAVAELHIVGIDLLNPVITGEAPDRSIEADFRVRFRGIGGGSVPPLVNVRRTLTGFPSTTADNQAVHDLGQNNEFFVTVRLTTAEIYFDTDLTWEVQARSVDGDGAFSNAVVAPLLSTLLP